MAKTTNAMGGLCEDRFGGFGRGVVDDSERWGDWRWEVETAVKWDY